MDTTVLTHSGIILGIAGFWIAAYLRFESQRHVFFRGRDLGCENAVSMGQTPR
jgi:hypothetical protein